MNKAKRDGTAIPIKIYKGSPQVNLVGTLIVGLPFLLCALPFFMYIIWYDESLKTNYLYLKLCIAIFVGLSGIFYMALAREYVAIYENGLQVQTSSRRYFSNWENMKAFDVLQRRGGSFGIILTHEAVDNLEEHGTSGQKYLLLSGHIPARGNQVDTKILLQTEFGQDLLRYAPQLFE